MSKPGSMRQVMPLTAAFIDAVRDAFGADCIDAAIRAGIKGEPDQFHATEAGQTVGTAFLPGDCFDARPSPAWLPPELRR